MIAFDDAPIAFTQAAGTFAVGPFERTEWVSPRTPWLGLDLDGSGCIEEERELFRFDRLAGFDENHDGRIDERDPAFARLVLWFDRNEDRRCTPGEIVGLADAGIVALDLDFVTPTDVPFGSHEGEHAAIWYRTSENTVRRGRIVDVYLAPLPL